MLSSSFWDLASAWTDASCCPWTVFNSDGCHHDQAPVTKKEIPQECLRAQQDNGSFKEVVRVDSSTTCSTSDESSLQRDLDVRPFTAYPASEGGNNLNHCPKAEMKRRKLIRMLEIQASVIDARRSRREAPAIIACDVASTPYQVEKCADRNLSERVEKILSILSSTSNSGNQRSDIALGLVNALDALTTAPPVMARSSDPDISEQQIPRSAMELDPSEPEYRNLNKSIDARMPSYQLASQSCDESISMNSKNDRSIDLTLTNNLWKDCWLVSTQPSCVMSSDETDSLSLSTTPILEQSASVAIYTSDMSKLDCLAQPLESECGPTETGTGCTTRCETISLCEAEDISATDHRVSDAESFSCDGHHTSLDVHQVIQSQSRKKPKVTNKTCEKDFSEAAAGIIACERESLRQALKDDDVLESCEMALNGPPQDTKETTDYYHCEEYPADLIAAAERDTLKKTFEERLQLSLDPSLKAKFRIESTSKSGPLKLVSMTQTLAPVAKIAKETKFANVNKRNSYKGEVFSIPQSCCANEKEHSQNRKAVPREQDHPTRVVTNNCKGDTIATSAEKATDEQKKMIDRHLHDARRPPETASDTLLVSSSANSDNGDASYGLDASSLALISGNGPESQSDLRASDQGREVLGLEYGCNASRRTLGRAVTGFQDSGMEVNLSHASELSDWEITNAGGRQCQLKSDLMILVEEKCASTSSSKPHSVAHQAGVTGVHGIKNFQPDSLSQILSGWCQLRENKELQNDEDPQTSVRVVKSVKVDDAMKALEIRSLISHRRGECLEPFKNVPETIYYIYSSLLLLMAPLSVASLGGLCFAFATGDIRLHNAFVPFLKRFTIFFQANYILTCIFHNDLDKATLLFDMACVLAAPVLESYGQAVYVREDQADLKSITNYCSYLGYLTQRGLQVAKRRQPMNETTKTKVESFEVVWTCKSAKLIQIMLPELHNIYQEALGDEGYATCRLTLVVTDPDHEACCELEETLSATTLYKTGCVGYVRQQEEW